MAACGESAVPAALHWNALRSAGAERSAHRRCGVRAAVHFAARAGVAAFAGHLLPTALQRIRAAGADPELLLPESGESGAAEGLRGFFSVGVQGLCGVDHSEHGVHRSEREAAFDVERLLQLYQSIPSQMAGCDKCIVGKRRSGLRRRFLRVCATSFACFPPSRPFPTWCAISTGSKPPFGRFARCTR